jgi:hypothetical protein
MTGKPLTREELLAIFMAGGRNGGERSHALPSEAYRDPSTHVEFERAKKFKQVKKSKGRK